MPLKVTDTIPKASKINFNAPLPFERKKLKKVQGHNWFSKNLLHWIKRSKFEEARRDGSSKGKLEEDRRELRPRKKIRWQ